MGNQQSHSDEAVAVNDLSYQKVNINNFETVRELGKGAFGKVRMVKHIKEQESYALKVISKGYCIKTNKIKYVLRERSFLEQLDHPLICNLRYAFQNDHYLYMALDLKLGGDLRYYLDHHRHLSEPLVCFWISELICAVKYLHLKGIMHRDIKPENILLDLNGHIHLTDFNIATLIPKDNDQTLTSQCGTLSYFAPEMIKGHGYDESVDWWCIGLIFYECIFGKRPWYEHEGKNSILNQIKKGCISYVQYENNMSKECILAVQEFLEIDPINRLGYGEKGWHRLLQHSFFSNIKWKEVNMKKGIPPIHTNLNHHHHHHHHHVPIIHNKLSAVSAQSSNISKSIYQNIILSSSSSITALSLSLVPSILSPPSLSSQKKNYHNDIQQPYQSEYDDILLNEEYHSQLNLLESSFLYFDWTMYDEYQGFLDKDTFCVGSPPDWVKPAFNNANNGRLLPMPIICTNYLKNDDDDENGNRLTTTSTIDTLSPVTPTFFNNNNNNNNNNSNNNDQMNGYDSLFDTPSSFINNNLQQQQQYNLQRQPYFQQNGNGKKLKRRSGTKYFNERRDWERRKSLLV
ncbi:unnamed protein product [Cunninghamella blakesleeana]